MFSQELIINSDELEVLLNLTPEHNRDMVRQVLEHEIAIIAFAQLELASSTLRA